MRTASCAARGKAGMPRYVPVMPPVPPPCSPGSPRCAPAACPSAAGSWCRRCASGQELSAAHSTSAPVDSALRTLSAPIAADTSAFFSARCRRTQQHSSAPGSSTSSSPLTARSSRRGRSPSPRPRSPVAGRMVGRPCAGSRRRRPSPPSTSTRNSGQLVRLRHHRRQRPRQPVPAPLVPGPLAQPRIQPPHHRPARPRGRHDRLVLAEDIGEVPGQRLGLVPVAGVVVRLPAAALAGSGSRPRHPVLVSSLPWHARCPDTACR